MAHTNVVILLAPSKTMNMDSSCPPTITPASPHFLPQAAQLAATLRRCSVPKIMQLMGVSRQIALMVQTFYANWDLNAAGKPALWAYAGDVYKGLQTATLPNTETVWAQNHVRIISGLYGLLRPNDAIQAYRLEMKTALTVGRHKNLPSFWTATLASYLDGDSFDWICNCSSDEYAKPVLKGTQLPVVTPVFLDLKPNGDIGTVPIYSKMMRGVFARWMIDNAVVHPEQLIQFAGHNYHYDLACSRPYYPAYRRDKMVPLRFD